ncbi:hypothetical protein MASR2M17_20950 [Aminivibrio sp.]
MTRKKAALCLVGMLALISVFGSVPAGAEEGQSVMTVVRAMMDEGMGEDAAKRIAESNRFMVQMCVDERAGAEANAAGERTRATGCRRGRNGRSGWVQPSEEPWLPAQKSREEKAFRAGMAMFSAVRGGYPRGSGPSVEILSERRI